MSLKHYMNKHFGFLLQNINILITLTFTISQKSYETSWKIIDIFATREFLIRIILLQPFYEYAQTP